MAQERIDSLISDKALKEFDLLVEKSDSAVASFEKLIARAVDINRALGGATSKSLADTNEQLKKMGENEAQITNVTKILVETKEKLTQATKKQTDSLDKQTDSLLKTVDVINNYKARLAELKKEQKSLSDNFKDGKISSDKYKEGLNLIAKEEAKLKSSTQQLNTVLRLQIKEQQAAAGSVTQLQARLALLTAAFDNLDKGQRKSTIGKELKKELQSVYKELIKLENETGRFQRSVGNYDIAARGIATRLTALGTTILGFSSVSEFFTQAFAEAEAAEAATARFKNTLEGFGKIESFDRLSDEATRLAESFGYLDNDDIIDVFDKLTTYGKLTERQITELTPVIIDFAAKGRISVGEATEKIIGGLEGQGKALKQYGINMKDGETVTERLGIVMTDLKQKVDGSAEAFRDTLTGGVAVSRQELKNLQEELGTNLLPIWDKIKVAALTGISGIVQALQGLGTSTRDWYDYFFNREELRQRQVKAGFDEQQKIADDFAKSFVSGIEGGVDALEKQLAVQQESLKMDLRRAIANRDTKDQGVSNTTAIIKALQTEIKLRKEKNTLADKVEGKSGAKSANAFFFDQELKDQAAQQKKISDAEALGLLLRINARQKAAELEMIISEGNRKKDVINAAGNTEKLNEISIKYAYDQKKIAQDLADDLFKIRASLKIRYIEQDKEINERFKEEAKLASEKEMADLSAANVSKLEQIAEARDEELRMQEIAYQEKLKAAGTNEEKIAKAQEDYAIKRAETELQYAREALLQQIKFTEAYLELARIRGEDTSAAEAKLANLKMQLSELETKLYIANNDKKRKSDQQWLSDLEKGLNKLNQIYGAATQLIGDFIQVRVDREKNAIQDTIDASDEKAKREIDAVAASTLTEEEKANRIQIINARTQANKEQLERRQRALDLQRARFEKAFGIGQIIINTAMAVTKQLTSGDPYTAIARAFAVGALGAAQLALAIAQPLPKFAHGTDDAPGGLSLVGDAHKKELVITPDGRLIETPDVPTVMNVPRHSIVLPDLRKVLEAGIHPRWGGSVMQKNEFNQEALVKEIRNLNRTVKNKVETHIHPGRNGWEMMTNRAGTWTNYLNKNL